MKLRCDHCPNEAVKHSNKYSHTLCSDCVNKGMCEVYVHRGRFLLVPQKEKAAIHCHNCEKKKKESRQQSVYCTERCYNEHHAKKLQSIYGFFSIDKHVSLFSNDQI